MDLPGVRDPHQHREVPGADGSVEGVTNGDHEHSRARGQRGEFIWVFSLCTLGFESVAMRMPGQAGMVPPGVFGVGMIPQKLFSYC